jgi:hypothetical protein
MNKRGRMDPISPELVLVDSELAREARARLSDPRKSNGTVPVSPIPKALRRPRIVGAGAVAESVPSTVRVPFVPLLEAEVAYVETEPGPHHLVRPKLLLVAVGLVCFILGVLLPPIGTEGDPDPSQKPLASRQEQRGSMIPRLTAPAASSIHSDPRKGETAQAESARATRSAGHVSTKRKENPRQSKLSQRATSPSSGRRRGAHESTRGRVPTRLFVWLQTRGAHYYHVEFLKGTRTMFEAWPTDPRVTVPLRGTFRGRSFAFTKGRYRWIVQPAFGPRAQARYGQPIVRSVWVVP